MEKRKPEEYAFPCSLIRAYEKKILSVSDYDRLLDFKTVNQQVALLAEFGYGDGKELKNPRDFEKILREGQNDVYELVYSVAPEKEELELFSYPNDYHNLKVLLKAESLKIDPKPYLVENGKFQASEIEEMVRERNFTFMTDEMKQAFDLAQTIFLKGQDPQEIDIILDKACYKDMLKKAEETANQFIIGYVKLLIDILNVNSFVRLREAFKQSDFLQKIFLDGGNIDVKFFLASWDENYQQIGEKWAPFGMKEIFQVGAVSVLTSEGKYTEFEKLSDNLRMKYLKDAKYISFGVEPLVGYMLAKETEIRNLRMIFTGTVTEVPKEVTQERLRAPYV